MAALRQSRSEHKTYSSREQVLVFACETEEDALDYTSRIWRCLVSQSDVVTEVPIRSSEAIKLAVVQRAFRRLNSPIIDYYPLQGPRRSH